jgi:adenylosuccinate synthase
MNRALIVVGLGFGDEGKGTTVDALVRQFKADIVVRYNGGAQAAHAVHTDLGMVHSFRQFGAGSFVPNVKTLLSDHMFVNPLSMLLEADNLPLAVFTGHL